MIGALIGFFSVIVDDSHVNDVAMNYVKTRFSG